MTLAHDLTTFQSAYARRAELSRARTDAQVAAFRAPKRRADASAVSNPPRSPARPGRAAATPGHGLAGSFQPKHRQPSTTLTATAPMPVRRVGAALADKRFALDLPRVRLEPLPRTFALGLTRRKELLS